MNIVYLSKKAAIGVCLCTLIGISSASAMRVRPEGDKRFCSVAIVIEDKLQKDQKDQKDQNNQKSQKEQGGENSQLIALEGDSNVIEWKENSQLVDLTGVRGKNNQKCKEKCLCDVNIIFLGSKFEQQEDFPVFEAPQSKQRAKQKAYDRLLFSELRFSRQLIEDSNNKVTEILGESVVNDGTLLIPEHQVENFTQSLKWISHLPLHLVGKHVKNSYRSDSFYVWDFVGSSKPAIHVKSLVSLLKKCWHLQKLDAAAEKTTWHESNYDSDGEVDLSYLLEGAKIPPQSERIKDDPMKTLSDCNDCQYAWWLFLKEADQENLFHYLSPLKLTKLALGFSCKDENMNLKTVENIKQVNFKLQSLPYLKSLQLFIRVENDRAENKGSSQLDSIEFDLNKCPNLEVLDLHFSGIPFETDMLKTSQLNSLKILKLALHMNKHAKKQCMDFSCLKDCSSLEVIHLYFASGCVANLTWLKNLKNLREIKLFMGYSGKWSVDAKFFLPLTECKELRVLHIQNIHVKDNVKFYELLKFFPCLEELLLGEEVVDEYIGMNKHKKKLRENYLIKKEDCRISSKGKVTGFYY